MALVEGAEVEVAGIAPAGAVAGQPCPCTVHPHVLDRSPRAPVFVCGVLCRLIEYRRLFCRFGLLCRGFREIPATAVRKRQRAWHACLVSDQAPFPSELCR